MFIADFDKRLELTTTLAIHTVKKVKQ